MLFNTFEFLFLFLPVVIVTYYLLPSRKCKIAWLVLSSYFFYGYWNYKFIPLLLGSTLLDFIIAKKMVNQAKLKRTVLLSISTASNLGLLFFFKYFNFFMDNIITGFDSWDIVLPVGISFYTFQSMSYTIDVYRKNAHPYDEFLTFAAYISLYPQLIAGPIIRHSDLVPQFHSRKSYQFNSSNFSTGLYFFIIGLSKKVIIADRIGDTIDPMLTQVHIISGSEAWLCLIGYTFQLYFDFSGYSDMAYGIGRTLNLRFPQNFHSPYKSKSITEFWQRWHITLGSWLRDYLYIPLGGNRGSVIYTYRNLFVTMLLGGLWHGANWTFLIWGGFHGTILGLERALRLGKHSSLPRLRICITFSLVIFGWLIFRSDNLAMASQWTTQLFTIDNFFSFPHLISRYRDKFLLLILLSLIICFKLPNLYERLNENNNLILEKKHALYAAILLIFSIMHFGANSPFLYFQF